MKKNRENTVTSFYVKPFCTYLSIRENNFIWWNVSDHSQDLQEQRLDPILSFSVKGLASPCSVANSCCNPSVANYSLLTLLVVWRRGSKGGQHWHGHHLHLKNNKIPIWREFFSWNQFMWFENHSIFGVGIIFMAIFSMANVVLRFGIYETREIRTLFEEMSRLSWTKG